MEGYFPQVLAGLAPGVDAAAVARCVGLVLHSVAGADVRGWKLREIVDEVRPRVWTFRGRSLEKY